MALLTSKPVSFLDICPEWALQSANDIQSGTTSQTDFQPAPLHPSWIIEGTPTARSLPLGEASDGHLSFGLWDCTSGTFIFKYRSDEIVHILEGNATVRGPGMELDLRPGVIALFPKGSTMHWTVHHYIKKLAIFRSVQSSHLGRIAGKLNRAWQTISHACW